MTFGSGSDQAVWIYLRRLDILDTLRGNVENVLDLLFYSFCVTVELVAINPVVDREALRSIIRIQEIKLVGFFFKSQISSIFISGFL